MVGIVHPTVLNMDALPNAHGGSRLCLLSMRSDVAISPFEAVGMMIVASVVVGALLGLIGGSLGVFASRVRTRLGRA
jgi:hypothetical protein